jgi:hypothetical protein
VRKKSIWRIKSLVAGMAKQILVEASGIRGPRPVPHGVARGECFENVLHTRLGLPTVLHPSLTDLLQVQCWRAYLCVGARRGDVQWIAVRATGVQTYNNTARRHGSGGEQVYASASWVGAAVVHGISVVAGYDRVRVGDVWGSGVENKAARQERVG